MQERNYNRWKGYYGKEPFDLRLTLLRLLAGLPVIAAVTGLGMLVFGGGYYVKNVLLRGEDPYAATSVYHVEYDTEDEKDVGTVFINEASWNTYLQSELFLSFVQEKLQNSKLQDMGTKELAGMLKAHLESDLRMPSVTVTSPDPEECLLVSWAVERTMEQDFAHEVREIISIEVVDPGDEAEKVAPDVRAGRAFLLSAVLSCFFAVVALLLEETGDDSIWLPSTLWRRYGLRTLGTINSKELTENANYFFRDSRKAEGNGQDREPEQGKDTKAAVCMVQEQLFSLEVVDVLKDAYDRGMRSENASGGRIAWFAVDSPISRPEAARKLREADGILLVVKAGKGAGRKLERVLEYLEQQDCMVTAVLLWEADERLIKWYGN